MIKRLKQSVKSSMMRRKIEEYEAALDEQYESYHDWILQREKEYRETLSEGGGALSVRIAEFNDFCPEFVEKADSDILVFANQKEFLDEYAPLVISDYFMQNPECILLYGDEDEWNFARTIRMNPWFKPDFSPDTLLEYLYYGNVLAFRTNALRQALRHEQEICFKEAIKALYEICLCMSLPPKKGVVGHLKYVLYHSPAIRHLCDNSMQDGDRLIKTNGKVSVIIPSKDHPDILDGCLRSLVRTADDTDYEIVVVDNGSNDVNRKKYEELSITFKFNYIYQPMQFHFSRMCNLGAEHAKGEFLLFLNDDIEALKTGWLSHMRKIAARAHAGAVGAKLYYPDSKIIQHAGITNLRLGPVHKLQFLEDVRPYYDGRNCFDCNVIAVTGACLMVRREVFAECGGFSDELPVAFNDVELCFRIYKKGYFNIVCNSIALCHHESLSRGNDESKEKLLRLSAERDKLYAMHPDLYGTDPFYHPYLCNEILDTNYSYAYQYPAGCDVAVAEPYKLKQPIKDEWYNECLQISMEYAGELEAWTDFPGKKGDFLYFQGYQFVIGSENPCFVRYLLCRDEKTKDVWKIPCTDTFRPDLDKNISEGHASLCGFALVIDKNRLPKGRYRVGCMAESLVGRQKLCRFTNKYIEV